MKDSKAKHTTAKEAHPVIESAPDLSRPAIEVKIPQVKLRLQDLAFLRSLAQPDGVHCHVPTHVMDKLRLLDLIGRTKIAQTPERLKVFEERKIQLLAALEKAIANEKWDDLSNLSYQLRNNERDASPKEVDVLTDSGKALLEHGEVKVRARKVGCI